MNVIYKDSIEEYPFSGLFYTLTLSVGKPSAQTQTKTTILSTVCDIQENGIKSSVATKAGYAVYFPLSGSVGAYTGLIENGLFFECSSYYGKAINGKIIGVYGSELGGAVAYIVDIDT